MGRHLRKDRDRKKAKRALNRIKILGDRKLLNENREKERIRKRQQREKKKSNKVASSTRLGSYNTPNTLRKAVRKLNSRSLSVPPRK